eukprot:gene11417-12607_t
MARLDEGKKKLIRLILGNRDGPLSITIEDLEGFEMEILKPRFHLQPSVSLFHEGSFRGEDARSWACNAIKILTDQQENTKEKNYISNEMRKEQRDMKIEQAASFKKYFKRKTNMFVSGQDYDISNIGKLDVSMGRNDSADNDNIFDNMSDNANILADEDIEDYNDIEAKAHVSCGRREGSVFREVLDDMRRILLESQPKLLQEMCKNLDKIRKSMYEEAPKEKGIMINPTVADPGQTQQSGLKFKRLLLRKRKSKFAYRVGEVKEK